jgi:hypothetical protein
VFFLRFLRVPLLEMGKHHLLKGKIIQAAAAAVISVTGFK